MKVALQQVWQKRRWWIISAAGVVIVTAVAVACGRVSAGEPDVPTAEVKQEEFIDRVQMRGEVKALRSVVLTAPSGAGDLQILKLAKSGSILKKGDLVAQFDASTLQRQLEQRQTELKQADAEIERTRALLRLAEEQDKTDLEAAKYAVERAKLDVQKAEILSAIEGEKNRIALNNADQKLKELEQKLASGRIAALADIESRRQKREKAVFDLNLVQKRIAALELRAPSDGMVAVLPNFRSRMFFGGGGPPEFREGDRAWPGAGIAELPDLNTVRVNGRVEEADRGRVRDGQDANVRIDALPDKTLTGRVAAISPLTKPDFSSWPPQKNFDLAMQLDQSAARLRPGMSATARIAVERLPNSIVIPAEAVFNRGGRSVVYVEVRRNFRKQYEERAIEIARRGPTQVAVARGLTKGERIALRDPTITEDQK